ncbi:glycosyltransferase [Candidatus Venteria ishoeyi]|uniref:Glycosyl transferases group 1 n=1 Tax=Candidatus Venteria ishoeyi TaxID=1899563 RepID=A0A1H6FAP5_9GAMM|nr:glycosyltransferase [Candidatus Venteria ishoeyi]SEH07158.1 Uncharacterised protein [Candidatus Venteria ishoeyi]
MSDLPDTQKLLQSLQAENTALRDRLHELSQQLAAGMNKPAFERALIAQPIAYALAGEGDCREDYLRLLAWVRQQGSHSEHADETADLQALQMGDERLQAELRGLMERLEASRWPQVRRHVPAVESIAKQVQALFGKTQNHQSKPHNSGLLMLAEDYTKHLPPPNPLSELQPNFMSIAGSEDKPCFMENTPKLGKQPFFLSDAKTVLAFTLYCLENDFYRLDLLFGTCLRVNSCQLRLIIREYNHVKPGPVVRVVQFDGMEVFDNQFHPIRFEPISDSAGKNYWIELDSPDARPEASLAVWCQEKSPWLQAVVSAEPLESTTVAAAPKNHQFSNVLSATSAQHLLLVSGLVLAEDGSRLRSLLYRWEQWLKAEQETAQVWICSALSASQQAECEAQGWVVKNTAALPVLLEEAKTSTADSIFLCDVHALPENNLLQQTADLWRDPQVAALIPCELDAKQRIQAAYAITVRDGGLKYPAAGMPVDHPEYNYRRKVNACHSTLLRLRRSALAQVDLSILSEYDQPLMQLNDMLMQFEQQGKHSLYQSKFSYQRAQAIVTPPVTFAEQQLFSRRWQAQLPTHLSAFSQPRHFINPAQRPTVLVVNDTLLEFDQDSASLRLYTLLKIWVKLGYHITFVADNADSAPRYRQALEDLGIAVYHGDYTIQQAMHDLTYDYAFIGRVEVGFRYIPFVRLLSPETTIFYDTVDIHYIREQRQAEIENDAEIARKAKITKRKELHNCKISDLVLTVTDEDGKHLQKDLPWLQYAVMPNIHTRPTLPPQSFAQRDGLVFIGNYDHAPNEDAVFYFVEEVFPLIQKKLPGIKLYLLGSHMKTNMQALASEHIKTIGWVDEVEPAFNQRRLFVSPLRYGAGMKGKLGQAMSLGLPVVTTSIGAEGMGLTDGENALIADDTASFAEAVCQAYEDAQQWQALADKGQAYIEQHYGETAVKQQLENLLLIKI